MSTCTRLSASFLLWSFALKKASQKPHLLPKVWLSRELQNDDLVMALDSDSYPNWRFRPSNHIWDWDWRGPLVCSISFCCLVGSDVQVGLFSDGMPVEHPATWEMVDCCPISVETKVAAFPQVFADLQWLLDCLVLLVVDLMCFLTAQNQYKHSRVASFGSEKDANFWLKHKVPFNKESFLWPG